MPLLAVVLNKVHRQARCAGFRPQVTDLTNDLTPAIRAQAVDDANLNVDDQQCAFPSHE